MQQNFGLKNPRITVLGLNPHAGENGHLGREELDIIQPVVARLQLEGYNLSGPIPADTAFNADWRGKTDAYLAMYHDQGLPVLKFAGFGEAVNITLGSAGAKNLSRPRYSPGSCRHGARPIEQP